MASLTVTVADLSARSGTDLTNAILETTDRNRVINSLCNYFMRKQSISSGSFDVTISNSALVAASGTVTCASVLAADTVTINGVAFTAVNGTPSGNQFDMSGTNAQTATSLAAAIAASSTALVQCCVTASASSAVVTVTSLVKGLIGNTQTLASSNGTRLAVSGARLAGGTGGQGSTVTNVLF